MSGPSRNGSPRPRPAAQAGRPGHTRTTPTPASPEVEAQTVANAVGQATALHLAQLLAQLLPQMMWQPACVLCVNAHKQAELSAEYQAAVEEYQVAAAAAQAAGEPVPEQPPELQLPPIQPSLTSMPIQPAPGQPHVLAPVCYGHFVAAPTVRAVGLVDAAGTPLITRAG